MKRILGALVATAALVAALAVGAPAHARERRYCMVNDAPHGGQFLVEVSSTGTQPVNQCENQLHFDLDGRLRQLGAIPTEYVIYREKEHEAGGGVSVDATPNRGFEVDTPVIRMCMYVPVPGILDYTFGRDYGDSPCLYAYPPVNGEGIPIGRLPEP